MDHRTTQLSSCVRALAADVSQPIDDGILYPETGKHVVVDGLVVHIAGDREIDILRQDIFPRIPAQPFIQRISIACCEGLQAVQYLARATQGEVEANTVVNSST